MSFEEPTDPRSGQIQLTELVTYEEQTPEVCNILISEISK